VDDADDDCDHESVTVWHPVPVADVDAVTESETTPDKVTRAEAEKDADPETEIDALPVAVDDAEPDENSDATAVVLGVEEIDADADADAETDGVLENELVCEGPTVPECVDEEHEVGVRVSSAEAETVDVVDASPERVGDALTENEALEDSEGAVEVDVVGVKDVLLETVAQPVAEKRIDGLPLGLLVNAALSDADPDADRLDEGVAESEFDALTVDEPEIIGEAD
jgi:hypothetical protein